MNTFLLICSFPVALAALALYIHKRHRKRQKLHRATTYRPPPQMVLGDPSSMMSSAGGNFSTFPDHHHHLPSALSIHHLTGANDEKAPPMDPQNANIDRVAPNDRRLAPVQLPVLDSAPPPYEAVVC